MDKPDENKVVHINPHVNHRLRIRTRVARAGFSKVSECEKVEYLLFFCIPMKDVRPIADRLLEKFGSLAGISKASYEELIAIPGVDRQTALFFISLRTVCQKIAKIQPEL